MIERSPMIIIEDLLLCVYCTGSVLRIVMILLLIGAHPSVFPQINIPHFISYLQYESRRYGKFIDTHPKEGFC